MTDLDPGLGEVGPGPDPSQCWPIVWGRAAGRIGETVDAFGSGAVAAGERGERATASKIQPAGLDAGIFVLHDLTPPGGAGNVDHAVVVGRTLVAIDSKCWAPGRYVSTTVSARSTTIDEDGDPVDSYHSTPVVLRDRKAFEPGLAVSSAFLASNLAKAVNWRGPVKTLLCIHCSDGDDQNLDLRRYHVKGVDVVRGDQLAAYLRRLAAKPHRGLTSSGALGSLVSTLGTPTVVSPYPSFGSAPKEPNVDLTSPEVRLSTSLSRSGLTLLAAGMAALMVAVIGWLAGSVRLGAGTCTLLLTAAGASLTVSGLLGLAAGVGRTMAELRCLRSLVESLATAGGRRRAPRVAGVRGPRPGRLVVGGAALLPVAAGLHHQGISNEDAWMLEAVLWAIVAYGLRGLWAWWMPSDARTVSRHWNEGWSTALGLLAACDQLHLPVGVTALAEAAAAGLPVEQVLGRFQETGLAGATELAQHGDTQIRAQLARA